jgi:CPA1 family monovalent cation:H+ antiporter
VPSSGASRCCRARIVIQGYYGPVHPQKVVPILGERVGEVLHEVVARRREAIDTGLDALRLQYPTYADALDQRLLRKAALRQEELEYDTLLADGLIGPELHANLRRSVDEERRRAEAQPRLDLALNAREMVAQVPIFAGFSSGQFDGLSRLLRPLFVVPGERIIRRGAVGDAIYFIASGAVEVAVPGGKVRLGRGDFVGEMALLSGRPVSPTCTRSATARSCGWTCATSSASSTRTRTFVA